MATMLIRNCGLIVVTARTVRFDNSAARHLNRRIKVSIARTSAAITNPTRNVITIQTNVLNAFFAKEQLARFPAVIIENFFDLVVEQHQGGDYTTLYAQAEPVKMQIRPKQSPVISYI